MKRTAPEQPFERFSYMGKPFRKDMLEKAYRIIEGIPKEVIALDEWYTQLYGPSCNTIACGLGWLSLHPFFNELGLVPNESARWPAPILDTTGESSWFAARRIFMFYELGERTSPENLFGVRDFAGSPEMQWEFRNHYRINHDTSDKDILLARLHYFYHHHSR